MSCPGNNPTKSEQLGILDRSGTELDRFPVQIWTADRLPRPVATTTLVALMTSGHIPQHNAVKLIWWNHWVANISTNGLEILLTITTALRMTGKWDGELCIMCKLAWHPIILNISSHANKQLKGVNWIICSALATAIGGGWLMIHFNPTVE